MAHVGLHEVRDVGLDVDDVLEAVVAVSNHADLDKLVRLKVEEDQTLVVGLALAAAVHRLWVEPGVPPGADVEVLEQNVNLNHFVPKTGGSLLVMALITRLLNLFQSLLRKFQ